MRLLGLVLLALPIVFCTGSASARVLRIEIERRAPILEGRPFGDRGGYELIEGRVDFGFDPASAANQRITDLHLAPLGESGLIEASAHFVALQPIDPSKRSGTALVDAVNRGRPLALAGLNRVALSFGAPQALDPTSEASWGDGFLMRQGLTILWVGWQADAPELPGSAALRVPRARHEDGSPIRGLARSDWVVDRPATSLDLAVLDHQPHRVADREAQENVLTRRRSREAERESIPRSAWRFDASGTRIEMQGGFEPGFIYELVYVSEAPPLVGLGFAAFRDFVSHARNDPTSPFPIERSVAIGISQSGRFLRHLFHEGFGRDEAGRRVFEGAFIQIAGAGRGGFNHRFSHPGRVGNPYENFFYPGDDFPFASRAIELEGRREGLFENERAAGALPRIFQVNTGYEYWGRGASLIHTTPDASRDLEPLEHERIYHIASAPHYSLPFPPAAEAELVPSLYRGSSVDTSVIHRALLRHLLDWVERDETPPASRVPRLADGTLVAADRLEYPIAGLQTPRSPHVPERLDFGPRWAQGIIDRQPPFRGKPHAVRVPAIDTLGSESTGITAMELRVPIGTYLPWALRTGLPAASDEMIGYLGSFAPLACEAEREAGDARPTLPELYPERAVYEARVDKALIAMIREGWMLPEDRAFARRAAMKRWEWMMESRCASDSRSGDRAS